MSMISSRSRNVLHVDMDFISLPVDLHVISYLQGLLQLKSIPTESVETPFFDEVGVLLHSAKEYRC